MSSNPENTRIRFPVSIVPTHTLLVSGRRDPGSIRGEREQPRPHAQAIELLEVANDVPTVPAGSQSRSGNLMNLELAVTNLPSAEKRCDGALVPYLAGGYFVLEFRSPPEDNQASWMFLICGSMDGILAIR